MTTLSTRNNGFTMLQRAVYEILLPILGLTMTAILLLVNSIVAVEINVAWGVAATTIQAMVVAILIYPETHESVDFSFWVKYWGKLLFMGVPGLIILTVNIIVLKFF